MCDNESDSKKYFEDIKKLIHKLEGTVEYKKSHGKKIRKVMMRVLNNIKE